MADSCHPSIASIQSQRGGQQAAEEDAKSVEVRRMLVCQLERPDWLKGRAKGAYRDPRWRSDDWFDDRSDVT